MHPNVYSSTTDNSQSMERALMSINWRVDKKDVCVCVYTGILLGNQKEHDLVICNNVDGLRVYYAKQNKSVRKRQIHDFTHMWNLRNKTDAHRGRGGKIK